MESLTETLFERVDGLIQKDRQPLLATTPSTTAISELLRRTEMLEDALRALTLEVQRLSSGSN